MIVCKGLYVILQDGPPIEKASNVAFDFHYLEPKVFTKGRYKRAYFLPKEGEQPLYTDQKKRFFSLIF